MAGRGRESPLSQRFNLGLTKLVTAAQRFFSPPQCFDEGSYSVRHLCSGDSREAYKGFHVRLWLTDVVCEWLPLCKQSAIGPAEQSGHISPDQTSMENDQSWQNPRLDDVQLPALGDTDKIMRDVPDYVMEYAPLVHLFSGEEFWPCDMTDHLSHITTTINYTPLERRYQNLTLANLDALNDWERGRDIFLTSDDDVEERPDWLEGAKNIPATNITGATGDDEDGHNFMDGAVNWEKPRQRSSFNTLRGGRSEAPAVLLVIDKGEGVVDAFWFFFYSFNLGNSVFNVRFGNHVGDWEHSAVRFHHGKPKAVYFSEHNFGSAYSYAAVEKLGKRPIIYSATGTHAMYPTAGLHPYVLPWGILHDQTDKGPLWDPTLNSHTYTYDFQHDLLRASNLTPQSPTEWFYYLGHWGDKAYPFDDKRQYRFAGQYHYVNGPVGPRFKELGRKKICGGPEGTPCVIKNWLGGSSRMQRWQRHGKDADAFSAMEEDRRANVAA